LLRVQARKPTFSPGHGSKVIKASAAATGGATPRPEMTLYGRPTVHRTTRDLHRDPPRDRRTRLRPLGGRRGGDRPTGRRAGPAGISSATGARSRDRCPAARPPRCYSTLLHRPVRSAPARPAPARLPAFGPPLQNTSRSSSDNTSGCSLLSQQSAVVKRYEAEHDWLTTVRLPPYAPELNPASRPSGHLYAGPWPARPSTHPMTSTVSSAGSYAGSSSGHT
jgi:hypothetical protein